MPEASVGAASHGAPAVGVVDIGSNSVRLVVYEGAQRSPLPLFNEKRICELGRGVAKTGRLDPEAVADSIALLARFRLLSAQMGVGTLHVVATAAVREAENGDEFIAAAEDALGWPVQVLSGSEEARLAASGVISGLPSADGLVGDLGGGSLELVDVVGGHAGPGETAPIGTLRLLDAFSNVRDAVATVDAALEALSLPKQARKRTIYAVGGTWRALARIHMERIDYPLHIIDHYSISADDALETARLVRGFSQASLRAVPNVSAARVKTIPYGALVLERLIALGRPRRVVFSARGLRDGLVYANLPDVVAAGDPLVSAATELSRQRARSLGHCRELCAWTDSLFEPPGPTETEDARRLRHAACMLADIGWRAHPDYRASYSADIIAHGDIAGVDHPGRAFLALAVYARHEQRFRDPLADGLTKLLDDDALARARILGSAVRLAYALSAAMPGVIPRCPIGYSESELVLHLPADLGALEGPTLVRRVEALAALLERSGRIEVVG